MAELRRCSRAITRSSANVRNPMCCASRWTVVCETLHLRAIAAALSKAIISGRSNISLATCSRLWGKTIFRLATRYFSSCSVAGGRWSLSCSMAPHLPKNRLPVMSVRPDAIRHFILDGDAAMWNMAASKPVNRPARACPSGSSRSPPPPVFGPEAHPVHRASGIGCHCRSRR